MKKIILPALAVLAMVAAPAAYARTMHASGGWYVLLDGNSDTCFAANRTATNGEATISGPFASQSKAASAMGATVRCATPQAMD